jgi:hypothetical protein
MGEGLETIENDWIAEAYLGLKKVQGMPHNWDGCSSPGTTPALVDAAENLLGRLKDTLGVEVPAPFVAPIAGGGFQFEWFTPKRDLEIEFAEPDRVMFLKDEKLEGNSGMACGELRIDDLAGIRELLLWLVEG